MTTNPDAIPGVESQADEDFRQLLQGLMAPPNSSSAPRWDFIGVPEGFVAQRRLAPTDNLPETDRRAIEQDRRNNVAVSPWEIPGFFSMTPQQQVSAMRKKAEEKGRRALRDGVREIAPRYKHDDPVKEFMRLDPGSRAQLQRDMVAAGLITGEYRMGILDSATAKGLEQAMGWANMTGSTYQQAIINIGRSGVRQALGGGQDQDAAPVFPIPTYLAPDYATLAQEIKGLFRSRLNRDPSDAELAGLADELSSYHREAYESQVEQMRHDFYTRQEASQGIIEGGQQGGGGQEVQEVDPAAQFMEAFESRYKHSLDAEDQEEQTAQRMSNLMGSLTVGAQVMGN